MADLVLLDVDPLADIRSTTKISELFPADKEFKRAAFDKMFAQCGSGGPPVSVGPRIEPSAWPGKRGEGIRVVENPKTLPADGCKSMGNPNHRLIIKRQR